MKKVWQAQIAEIRANASAFLFGAAIGVIALVIGYGAAVAGGMQ